MKKHYKYLTLIVLSCLLSACDDKSFDESFIDPDFGKPRNLFYSEVLSAREFSTVTTNPPTIDTDGIVPLYEIVSGRKGDGTLLDQSYMDFVNIIGYDEIEKTVRDENQVDGQDPNYTVIDSRLNGTIEIINGNNFGVGDYYFTIKATTEVDGNTYSEVFDDVLHIVVGPQPATLLYSPVAQNLIVGVSPSTSQPYITGGNPDITFGLGSDTDKLEIDPTTGVISLKTEYTTVENDTIYPAVQAISNINGEITEYQGDGFLWIVASNDPVDLPRVVNYFFYPALASVGDGYIVDVIELGDPNNLWDQTSPTNLTGILEPDLPVIPNKRGIFTNIVSGGVSTPHESDVIMNSQNLSIFTFGFDVKAVFYYSNQFVEYFVAGDPNEGKTPTNLEVYISTDYTGDNLSATWTLVNDLVTSRVETRDSFSGMSYPGPWNPPFFTDFKREEDKALQKSDGKWCRAELDLNPYLNETNFTLKFKFASYFTEPVPYGGGAGLRGGRYYISDVYYKAQEE